MGIVPSAALVLVRYLGLGPKPTLSLPFLPLVFSFLARVRRLFPAVTRRRQGLGIGGDRLVSRGPILRQFVSSAVSESQSPRCSALQL
jgi:hypothetical protein